MTTSNRNGWWARASAWYDRQKSRPAGFVATRTVERYSADNVSMRAGMLAYFVFLSLFPLLLLVISLVSFLVTPQEAQQVTFRLLSDFPPQVRHLIQENIVSAYAARGPVTIVGLLALLWSSLYLYSALAVALNLIAPFEEARPWYRMYLQGTVVVAVMLVLVIGIFAADAVSQTIGGILAPYLPAGVSKALWSNVAWMVSLAGSFALFLALYSWVPAERAPCRVLWPGAALATVLWKLSKTALGWYFESVSANAAVYGSIGVVMALLVWLYVTAVIVLLGAELNRALQEWRTRRDEAKPCEQRAA